MGQRYWIQSCAERKTNRKQLGTLTLWIKISSVRDTQIQDKHFWPPQCVQPVAKASAGGNIRRQELGRGGFPDETLRPLFPLESMYSWLAKSCKTMSGDLRSTSESRPLAEPHSSFWLENPHSALLMWWEIKGGRGGPLRSIKMGAGEEGNERIKPGRAHNE